MKFDTADKSQLDRALLEDFLNVFWLRPEAGLFMAISAYVLKTAPATPFQGPSLDLGAGNGTFLFLAGGGQLSLEYDYYVQAGNLDKYWDHADIYDNFNKAGKPSYITRVPEHKITYAFDHKDNLRKQAEFLNFYEDFKVGNADERWPFEDGQLQSVFSNIFYWLQDPQFLFRELSRVLKKDGKAFLALQDPALPDLCPTYRPEDYPAFSETLTLLNRGRNKTSLWRRSVEELEELCEKNDLEVIYKRGYLSDMVMKIWDIGLRPLSPVLISMANTLSEEERRKHKAEWLKIITDLLLPVYLSQRDVTENCGYIYLVVQKR